jgi:hypothetical protein
MFRLTVTLVFLLGLLALVLGAKVDPTKVVIVLSHGRSGSTEACSIVQNIVEGRVYAELFGGSKEKMASIENPLELMLGYLRHQQAEFPGKVVGFKWKPYYHSPKYQEAWDWVAQNGVKVVYNFRNPLDVFISNAKAHEEDAVYNCKAGDTRCVNTVKAIKTTLKLDNIHGELERLKIEGISMISHLSKNKINYYDVTYEGLNHGTMQQRLTYLQGLADFLDPGHVAKEADLDTKTLYSGHYHQNETVTNYAELVAALKGTRFALYLH